MGRDRAAYMREYRARKVIKRAQEIETDWRSRGWDGTQEGSKPFYAGMLRGRIVEHEQDIRQLRSELADLERTTERFNSTPFTPVPKKAR